jgi:hypothetical protein
MTATFSPDRVYRYALWRELEFFYERQVMFIGLNPSTADETNDDPTVRRCIRFAKTWGFSRMCMTNIFAFRATDPSVMLAAADPVGPENDKFLRECADRSHLIVAAWGNHGGHLYRDQQVLKLIPKLQCFGKTKSGNPKHPLYLRKDSLLQALLYQ